MKQRLKKLVAMLGIASLVSSQTVTALAEEVAVATDVSVVSEEGGEEESELLPIENLRWSEEKPGHLVYDNPNEVGVNIFYLYQFFRDGVSIGHVGMYSDDVENGYYCKDKIDESGEYQVNVYLFQGNIDFRDVINNKNSCEYMITSSVYNYIRPENVLPLPENIKFDVNGILSWDIPDNEYVMAYNVELLEIAQGFREYVRNGYCIPENGQKVAQIDFSDSIEEGKKYAVVFDVYSNNIEEWASHLSSSRANNLDEVIYREGDEPVVEENTLLPVVFEDWKGGTLTFTNPNTEKCWIVKELCKDGEVLASYIPYSSDTLENPWIESWDLQIDEVGDYQLNVYVLPGDMTFEAAHLLYKQRGVVSSSPILRYTNTNRLEVPTNITFDENGVVTWSEVENADNFNIHLYKMSKDGTEPRYVDGEFDNDHNNSADFSATIEEGTEYAISIRALSHDIFEYAHSEWSELILINDTSEKTQIKPVTNLQWNGSHVTFDNPNTEDTVIMFVLYNGEQVSMVYDNYFDESGATSFDIDCTEGFEESGEYVAAVYVMPTGYSYQDFRLQYALDGVVNETEALHYINPGRMENPSDLTFDENGIVAWSADERASKYIAILVDVTDGTEKYVAEQYVVQNGVNATEVDFSAYLEEDKEYAVKFRMWSKDVFVNGHSLWSDVVQMSKEQIEEPSTEESALILPVINLVWDDTTLFCDNQNVEDIWVMFELSRDGEVIETADTYCEADEYMLSFDCAEDITEAGEYVGKIYVMSAEYSYEEFLEKYATEGLVSVSDTLICTVPESSEPESSEPESSEPESSEPESSEPESSEPESSEPESSEPESSEPESSEPESSEPESSEPESSEPESSEPESSEPESSEPESSEPESSEPESSEPESSEPESSEPESSEPESSEPESSEPESSEPESSEPESSEPESSEPESSEPESSEPESSEPESSEPESSEPESSEPEKQPEKKPASSSSSSSNKSSSSGVTVPKKIAETVEIIEEIIPLASSVEEAGHDFVDLILTNKNVALSVKQLEKYFGKDMVLQAHLGNGVGYTINANTLSKENAAMNISAELNQLDTFAEGFATFHVKPAKSADLGQEIGLHINVGQEYEGKKAYIYAKNITTGELEFVGAWTVNSIGNIGFFTDTMTDVVVMIEN